MPTVLSTNINRNSTMNSDSYVNYILRIGLPFSVSGASVVKLDVPNTMQCSNCITSISSYNSSTYYSTYITQTINNGSILITQNTPIAISILLSNHYSFEPMPIMVSLLTFDSVYSIAYNSITLANNMPNTITLSYIFAPTSQQYL